VTRLTRQACTCNVNTKARSHNHCWRAKPIGITLSRCVSVFLLSITQSACAVSYWHMWPVRLYHVFPHYLINNTIFGKKKVIEQKARFLFSLQLVSGTLLPPRWIMRDTIGNVHRSLSTPYSCRILMKREFSGRIFDKSSNIKFHENPSSRSQAVSCGRTYMKKLTVAFRNFANAPKNAWNCISIPSIHIKCAQGTTSPPQFLFHY
jgi:hypothetical protein